MGTALGSAGAQIQSALSGVKDAIAGLTLDEVEDVAQTALYLASFPSAALTGQAMASAGSFQAMPLSWAGE